MAEDLEEWAGRSPGQTDSPRVPGTAATGAAPHARGRWREPSDHVGSLRNLPEADRPERRQLAGPGPLLRRVVAHHTGNSGGFSPGPPVAEARRAGAARRLVQRIRPGPDPDMGSGRTEEILAIHEALEHLAQMDPSQAQVEMRFFGGLSVEENPGDYLRWELSLMQRP
jgi:hypothetical protein